MIITQTPLRISFLGGGTDLEEYYSRRGGMVVSSAIDKYVFVIVKERYDEQIFINYMRKEIVSSVGQIEHELVREAMIQTGIDGGIEITMLADIPSEGSGLGSSSSILVGLLNALYSFRGQQVTADQLAREACEIEIERCKKPIGKQDQYIAAFGGLCSFTFQRNGEVQVEPISLLDSQRRAFSTNLMLFYTGVTRKSSEILREQSLNTQKNMEALDDIKALAAAARDAIANNKYDLLGQYMHRNWILKKGFSSTITNGEIDEMYERALSKGATGGKIAGAGGGGFLLLYCTVDKQDQVRRALAGFRELPFLLEKDGSKVIFNYRRYGWK